MDRREFLQIGAGATALTTLALAALAAIDETASADAPKRRLKKIVAS
jgi:hypothetical protein